MRIEDVEGIGPAYAQKLIAAGVETTDGLLEHGSAAAGRSRLAATTGLEEDQLLEWVNHADLMRVPGVGSEYSDLLEAAGVDSPKELAQRNPANLTGALAAANERSALVRQLPAESVVSGWIDAAKTLDRRVTH